ncbi:uncharacterized protein LOC134220382 isoform X2 [Armigeres subalbatus]
MSRFLYRLTQEIVTSRNFSDDNINRICRKHYRNSSYPDKARLTKTINDLKHKLEVQYSDWDHGSSEAASEKERRCVCKKPRRPSKQSNEVNVQDKSISVQSFNKLPGMLVNQAAQFEGALTDHPNLPIKTRFSNPLKTCLEKTSSTDSISTITTYNFSSPMYSPFSDMIHHPKSLEEAQTLIGQILSNSKGDQVEDLVDSCCGRGKDSTADSSADMVMRMAASDRVLRGQLEPKCPLHRCEEFGHSSAAGGCGTGCGSDMPLPKPTVEETDTPPATCCGRRKSRKTSARKGDAAGKGKNGKKSKKVTSGGQNRCDRK